MVEVHGFNWAYDSIVKDIITDCSVSLPYTPDPSNKTKPKLIKTTGLWDTGASHTVITKGLATTLGLAPIGKVETHHAGGKSLVDAYLINIYLPNQLAMSFVQVTECIETIGRFGLIIGMDVISKGDFALSHYCNKTTFSFRMPSIYKIDLAKDCIPQKDATNGNPKIDPNTPRNSPCPCGSGKRFKRCHGLK